MALVTEDGVALRILESVGVAFFDIALAAGWLEVVY